jgi:hypothetical protein
LIVSRLTNGFGNNLFQCIAGKLIANNFNTEHYFVEPYAQYYGTSHLVDLGFNKINHTNLKKKKPIIINDENYAQIYSISHIPENMFEYDYFLLNGYFENKDYYEKNRNSIKSWFPEINKKNNKDLVFHFRTGDRLFYKNEFDSKPSAQKIENAINKFNFEKLHIVTDMPGWKKYNPNELGNVNFHLKVPDHKSVSLNDACKYYNECFEMLESYNPVIVKRDVLNDFNFIRSFDNILFQHGTMSWWAAFLSDASSVGVYGPWRPWKGKSNKNLSKINLSGWFQWD